jgi:hypothetical protein
MAALRKIYLTSLQQFECQQEKPYQRRVLPAGDFPQGNYSVPICRFLPAKIPFALVYFEDKYLIESHLWFS